MVLRQTSTFTPAIFERLKKPAFNLCKRKGWISIVLINSATGNIRECVPETIESRETLQYLGLTRMAARQAFSLIVNPDNTTAHDSLEFIEFAKLFVGCSPDCSKDDTVSEWDDVMREMGVQDLWIKAILDPRYAELRQEHTAKYWVQQTMEDKWKHLITLNQRMESILLKVEAMEHQVEERGKAAARVLPLRIAIH